MSSPTLLSLVQETLAFIRQEWPKKEIKPASVKKSAPLPEKIEKAVVKEEKKQAPTKPVPVFELSAVRTAFLSVKPKAKLFDRPPPDTLAEAKKEAWKKQVQSHDLLLVFSASCHPVLQDMEKAINTHIMTAHLLSLEELTKQTDLKARFIVFEEHLKEAIKPLQFRFSTITFIEIPDAPMLSKSPVLKKKVWSQLQSL